MRVRNHGFKHNAGFLHTNEENTEKQCGALKINCESTDLGGTEAALNVKNAVGFRGKRWKVGRQQENTNQDDFQLF